MNEAPTPWHPALTAAEAAVLAEAEQILARLVRRDVVSGYKVAQDYLRMALAGKAIEQLAVIYLDRRNRVIDICLAQRGTVDAVQVYPREIVRTALYLAAKSVIFGHNHPGGDPTPSQADIVMTRALVSALGTLGITVHDHLVVTETEAFSFRSHNLLEAPSQT